MGRYKISGLSKEEKDFLAKALDGYRAKMAENQKLDNFYNQVIQANGFDALGRFTNYFETGLERVVWVICDERKEGYAAFVQCNEGDIITLLDDKGNKLKEPLALGKDDAEWAEYFGMCSKLGISPSEDFKYFAGLKRKK